MDNNVHDIYICSAWVGVELSERILDHFANFSPLAHNHPRGSLGYNYEKQTSSSPVKVHYHKPAHSFAPISCLSFSQMVKQISIVNYNVFCRNQTVLSHV